MGNCLKAPLVKPTINNDIDGNETSCCYDISDHCPSTCCIINIIRTKSKENLHK